MWAKVAKVLLDWVYASLLVPFVTFLYDSYRIRKLIKEKDLKIAELEKAVTVLEKINAANNLP